MEGCVGLVREGRAGGEGESRWGGEGLFGSGGVCVWCLTGSVDVCSDVRPAVERVCPVHAPLAAGGGGSAARSVETRAGLERDGCDLNRLSVADGWGSCGRPYLYPVPPYPALPRGDRN